MFASHILCKALWPTEKHKSWCGRQTKALARLAPVWRMLALVMSDPFCDIPTNKHLDTLAFFETVEETLLCFQVSASIHWASQKEKPLCSGKTWSLITFGIWDQLAIVLIVSAVSVEIASLPSQALTLNSTLFFQSNPNAGQVGVKF